MPLPGTLKPDELVDAPDKTALLACSRGSFKEIARDTHGSPAVREPLTDDAAISVECPMFPGHPSGRSIVKKPEPIPDDVSTSYV
jgi:hypothetical protein